MHNILLYTIILIYIKYTGHITLIRIANQLRYILAIIGIVLPINYIITLNIVYKLNDIPLMLTGEYNTVDTHNCYKPSSVR